MAGEKRYPKEQYFEPNWLDRFMARMDWMQEANPVPATERNEAEAPLPISTTSSAFGVLGVSPKSSLQEIKRAYHHKVGQWHPDKLEGMAPELKHIANDRLAQINAAYELLCKEKTRTDSA